ncbi:unnamed protein product [Rotaria sp. Silwood1]|nr:unnamed protein product [Rotaria sp. Silwood1]
MEEDAEHSNEYTEVSPLLRNTQENSTLHESLYEEVASNVSNRDDPTILCFTFRSCFLGILLTSLLAFTNQFFSFRTMPIFLNMLVAQVLSYPMGKSMALILPSRSFLLRGGRWRFSLNPGPFTIKEHCIIAVMANTASGISLAIQVITIQRVFYNHSLNYVLALLFVLSSQTLGYGMAGVMRRYVVWPVAMIWPSNLINCAMFRAFNNEDNDEVEMNSNEVITVSRKMSRSRFFYLMLFFQILWYWIPGYICPILSAFSLICYINSNNVVLSQLTSVNGLGLGSFQLDWNAWVSFLDSPIVVPFW